MAGQQGPGIGNKAAEASQAGTAARDCWPRRRAGLQSLRGDVHSGWAVRRFEAHRGVPPEPFPKLNRVDFGAWEGVFGDGVFRGSVSGLLHRLHAVPVLRGVNGVCPGLPSWTEQRWSGSVGCRRCPYSLALAGPAECPLPGWPGSGECPWQQDAGGVLRAPLSGRGIFRCHLEVGDVYRNPDFDRIGGNKGIRS